MNPDKLRLPPWLLRPVSALAGLCVGMAALAWAGRAVARRDWHPGFVRFHPAIAPESMYEPTVAEACAIVRSQCRPDQVLVIVGGNSIFLGVGQPVDKVWTRRLQDDLGGRYAVVNLAFRGSVPNDGGAVIAEALLKEFPRQVYVANTSPLFGSLPLGSETYRFFLLDAYYKGQLLTWPPRDQALSYYWKTLKYVDFPETERQVGAELDSVLYFRNLWNWWSYNYHFTFATTLMPHDPEAHMARKSFADREDDFEGIPFEVRFSPQVAAAEMRIARQYTASYFHEGPGGDWTLDKADYAAFLRDAHDSFPDAVKPRTLIAISRNSPYYTRQLSAQVRTRDETAIRATVAGLKSLGYDAVDYGSDFDPRDYGDRTHLTSSGGVKLADDLAPEIEALSGRLGYLRLLTP